MADEPCVELVLTIPETRRLLQLTHTDLARVEGNIVLARRKMESSPLSGAARNKARKVLESCPQQAEVLRGAHDALRDALNQTARRKKVKQ